MKKLILGLLVLTTPAFGSIAVTPGVGKTVHTDTVGGEEYQAVKIIDGTTGGSSSATVTSIGLKVDLSSTSVQVKVTSTTIPTGVADGIQIPLAGTNIGQTLVTGVPWGLLSSTYTALISSVTQVNASGASEGVLISSAGANTYIYLCGCVFTNTTATNGAVFLESPQGSITNKMPIGAPANYVPAGIWPGCTNPFFRSAANSTIFIYQNVSTTASAAIYMKCIYYTGP